MKGKVEAAAVRASVRGTALFAIVPIAILMMTLMVAFVGRSVESSQAGGAKSASFRARAAAENAAALAIADIWGDFEAVAAGQEQLWRLRTHLDGRGMTDQSSSDSPQALGYIDSVGLATNGEGRYELDGVEIESLSVYRVDHWDSTDVVIEVTAVSRRGQDGSSRERRAAIQEVFAIAPPEWDGLDYALLANNINCLLCHTTVDNAERVYNSNPLLAGTFDTVKVGSIESIHFRSDPDSRVAGALLIGADALLGDGHEVDDWSQFNLEGSAPSPGGTIAKIQEDQFGNALFGGLEIFDRDSPSASANMFLDFFENADATDYELPTSFPSPFPDNGGVDPVTGLPRPDLADNGVVDDAEFLATVQGAAGRISGGSISVVEHGDKITGASDLAEMMAGADASVSGLTSGNVFLYGTKENPLILDGEVAIDGDVIIAGYVKGSGSLQTRGNVYVASDVIYDDGGLGEDRTFGMAADGTENSLAIAAGGNIMMGDYFHPAWGEGKDVTGYTGGGFNFTMDELSIFNRMEWMKTQPTLPGEAEYVQVGEERIEYPEVVTEDYQETVTKYKWVPTGEQYKKWTYEWVTHTNGLPAPYTETWQEKVAVSFVWKDKKEKVENGTKTVWKTREVETGVTLVRYEPIMEWVTPQVPNPYFEASHLPRYYNFQENARVPVLNKDGYFDEETQHWVSDEHASNTEGTWDGSKLTVANPKNKTDSLLYDDSKNPIAIVSTLGPTGNWISQDRLEETIKQLMAANPDGSKTLEVNATLYSANAIIGITPSRNSDHTDGTMIVNGGIVAADIGLLAPEGTQVNYDGRGARALSITADSGLTVTRRLTTQLRRP